MAGQGGDNIFFSGRTAVAGKAMYLTSHSLSDRFPKGIGGVVFDCDGVMFDTWESNMFFYNLVLERMGLPPMTPSQERYVHMATVIDSLAHIIPPSHAHRLKEARKSVSYTEEIMPKMVMAEGLMELLEVLRGLNIRLAVHTNRTNTMECVLERFGLSCFFDQVMTASQVTGKPSPEGLFQILRTWNMSPDQIVFIGDTQADEHAARHAGVDFWAYRNQQLLARQHVHDFWAVRGAFLQWQGWPV